MKGVSKTFILIHPQVVIIAVLTLSQWLLSDCYNSSCEGFMAAYQYQANPKE